MCDDSIYSASVASRDKTAGAWLCKWSLVGEPENNGARLDGMTKFAWSVLDVQAWLTTWSVLDVQAWLTTWSVHDV